MKIFEAFLHQHELSTIDTAIMRSFKQLARVYSCRREGDMEGGCALQNSRLIFPMYRDGRIRVSEQEMRFMFADVITRDLEMNDWFYSVETPTIHKYLFCSDKNNPEVNEEAGRSAMIDLTIHGSEGERIALIEFKANNPDEFAFKKDFCKLENEPAHLTFFVMIVAGSDKWTEKSIRKKVEPNIGPTTLFYCYDILLNKELLEDIRYKTITNWAPL